MDDPLVIIASHRGLILPGSGRETPSRLRKSWRARKRTRKAPRVDGAAADAHIRRRARTAAAGAAGAPTGFVYSFSQ